MTQAPGIQPQSGRAIRAVRAPWLIHLGKLRSVVGLIALVVVSIIISPLDRHGANIFLKTDNLTDVLRQLSEIGIIALGMTLVILTAGIDLSVGSTLAISATITALVLMHAHPHVGSALHITIAIVAGLAVAAAAGFINGFLLSRFSMQPFIVTLSTMMLLRGLARNVTDNKVIDFDYNDGVSAVFSGEFSRKAVVICVYVGLAALFAILLKMTVFGRYVRAIGDNERAAVYAGIPVVRIKIWVYLLCGLVTGAAGVLHAATVHQGNPNDGFAYELDAIAAVVIGGTSLAGGRGSIIGTVVGTLIIGVLTNILELNHQDSNRQLVVKAVIIILAVLVQSKKQTT